MASINCLIDYIGLRECSESTPLSGIFINEYPGISLEMIDELANSEQVNFDGVWEDVQKRSARMFANDVNAEFNKRYNLKQIQRSVDLGKIVDATSTTAAAAQYRGFTIELNQKDTSFVSSNLQQISIQTIKLYLPTAIATTVKIFDLDEKVELFSKSVVGAVGFNTINVNSNFDSRRVFVAYDSTLVNSVLLDITRFPQDGFHTGSRSSGCCFSFDCNAYLKIKGGTATIADPFTVTEGNNTFGLTGVFTIACTWERLVCNNLEAFTNAWVYLLVSELMSELKYSREITEAVVFDRNKSESLRLEYMARYRGGEFTDSDTGNVMTFDGELPQLVDSTRLNERDACLECNDTIRFSQGTP